MTSTPRNANLVLLRADRKRRDVGSVVCRGASTWFKTWANAAYLHQNNNALSVNILVLEQLNKWGVKDVYFLLGSGYGKRRYRTTVAKMEQLGTVTNANEGWGWNRALPLEHWDEDRSTFNLGYVPDGQELLIEVPVEPTKPVAELTEKLTTRRGGSSFSATNEGRIEEPGRVEQLDLFGGAARVA